MPRCGEAPRLPGASGAWVTIDVRERELRFEVGDDGRGIHSAGRGTVAGLQNIRDRLEALGSTVRREGHRVPPVHGLR